MAPPLLLENLTACGVDQETAALLLPQINHWLTTLPATECWQQLTQHLLKPNHPFSLHQFLYATTFSNWDKKQGPPPAWFPSETQIQSTNIAALMNQLELASYAELQDWSARRRAEFWDVMIQRLGIRFAKQYAEVVDLSQGTELPHWLVNARLNIVESCFTAAEDAPAIVFQPEVGTLSIWSYADLNRLTNRVANSLLEAGFQPGEAIAIAMPMTAEAVAIYLGIIKAGCVVVSIADSFAAGEIATRLRISNAKAIFTQDFTWRSGKLLPLYTKIVDANAPRAIVLSYSGSSVTKLRSTDLRWESFLSHDDRCNAVIVEPSAYINILFSSGTTGEPKAIPWTQTTPIKCAADGHLHHDIHPGDVVAWPTNLGWMMGPWLIYASLINQGTIALYTDSPTTRAFGQFVQDARVTVLGVVPSLVSQWRTTDCLRGLDWSAIKAFSSTGECSNPQDMLFLMSLAGYRPIIEYCGGTEIGGAYVTGTLVQPAAPATFTTPALGLDFVLLDDNEQFTDKGEAFIIPPSIGLSTELLNRNHHQVYFANCPFIHPTASEQQDFTHPPIPLRRHGDHFERLSNGYYRAHGRVDDTMNLGGIKVSATEIECVLIAVPEMSEAAAIAIPPSDGGPSQLVIYAVVSSNTQVVSELLKTRLQNAICQQLNPLFRVHDVVIVESLPRTASNKVMRRVLRDWYQQGRGQKPEDNEPLQSTLLERA